MSSHDRHDNTRQKAPPDPQYVFELDMEQWEHLKKHGKVTLVRQRGKTTRYGVAVFATHKGETERFTTQGAREDGEGTHAITIGDYR